MKASFMSAILACVTAVALSGCVSGKSPIYGIPAAACSGVATVENSVSGSRFLKDRFVLRAVNGREVVLAPKPEMWSTSLHCGRQQIESAFVGFQNGNGLLAIGAEAQCTFDVVAGRRYVVRGEIVDEVAWLWLEDAEVKQAVMSRLPVKITARQQFDPVRRYP